MYLRRTTRRKDGKVHHYWRLVRSVRVGGKVVQQTVAQLGELDAAGRAQARALARTITGGREQPDLFTPTEAELAVPVRLRRIRLERGRTFGDVWLGWTLWRALRLDEVLARLLPEGREAVPWATMAAVLVLARLCEPSSELHIAEDWYRRTALEDLLALPAARVNDDRLYRALDQLLAHKTALEQHLVARLGELFALDYDLLPYDVTSTYFEGQAAGNPLAMTPKRRGATFEQRLEWRPNKASTALPCPCHENGRAGHGVDAGVVNAVPTGHGVAHPHVGLGVVDAVRSAVHADGLKGAGHDVGAALREAEAGALLPLADGGAHRVAARDDPQHAGAEAPVHA